MSTSNEQVDLSTIDLIEIYSVTQLDTSTKQEDAEIIPNPKQSDTIYITFKVKEDQLIVDLLPAFFEGGHTKSKPSVTAISTLKRILNNYARRTCDIKWTVPGSYDASDLPPLPSQIKELSLRNMPEFLANSVTQEYWAVEFVKRLNQLEKLTLFDCVYDPKSISSLENLTNSLEISVYGGEVRAIIDPEPGWWERIERDKCANAFKHVYGVPLDKFFDAARISMGTKGIEEGTIGNPKPGDFDRELEVNEDFAKASEYLYGLSWEKLFDIVWKAKMPNFRDIRVFGRYQGTIGNPKPGELESELKVNNDFRLALELIFPLTWREIADILGRSRGIEGRE